MHEYQAMMKVKSDRENSVRGWRNAQFVEDLRGIEKAQPRGLRFHFHLPRFSGFRLSLHRQPRCAHEPLSAH